MMDQAIVISFVLSVMTASTPLLLAATGELVTEKSGVLNLGVEGMMLVGAIVGFAATVHTGSPLLGVIAALFAGVAPAGVPIQIGGDAAEIVLPYSGIKAGVTTVIFQYTTPRDSRAYVPPDIPAPLSAADYFMNRDTGLEALLQVINN